MLLFLVDAVIYFRIMRVLQMVLTVPVEMRLCWGVSVHREYYKNSNL